MKRWPILLILVLLSALLHFSSNLIADPDALYHMRHAAVLRTSGIFDTSFPWAQFSSIKTFGADLWYGFHLLLIPFTFIADPIVSIKVAGFVITLAALTFYYSAFVSARIFLPSMWAFLAFLSSSQFLWRASMLRPHTLTSALSILLLPALLYMNPWALFALTFFIASIHSTSFWIPIIVIAATILASYMTRQSRDWRKIGFALGGIGVGILARPNPMHIFPLLRMELIDIQFAKFKKIPLSIGSELKPFDVSTLLQQYAPLLLLVVAILVSLFYLLQRKRAQPALMKNTLLMSSTLVSLFFLLLTIFIARRFIDIANASLILAIGIATSSLLPLLTKNNFLYSFKSNRTVFSLCALLITFLVLHNALLLSQELRSGVNPLYMEMPARWLSDHTKPGEIVFHTQWDDFPKLFFWNTDNYYINGMDPIFMYNFDSSLYFKQLYYAIDAASAYTCGADRCKRDEVVPTRTVLEKDFRSSYVLLDEQKNSKLISYLAHTAGYEAVYRDSQFHIFKIIPLSP